VAGMYSSLCDGLSEAATDGVDKVGREEQRVAFRCHIVLRAIAGRSNTAIAKELRTSRPTVLLRRAHFAHTAGFVEP
jgi:FixJ family two-component response regulator